MTESPQQPARNGFTLLELSVVMTIIALIIGSVIVGSAMIHNAQVNSIIGEVARYTQAIGDFQDKYKAYPGDMSNATSYWGTDPGGCPTPTTGAGGTPWNAMPHTTTCNGDGNGLIGQSGVLDNGGYVAAGPGAYEWYRAWQQLSDAGLIESSYNGIMGTASANNAVLGVNVPAARVPGTGYSLFYASYPSGSTDWWPIMDHVLVFGSVNGTGWTNGVALTPGEAYGLDTKLDDGVPSTGKVLSFLPALSPNCATTSVQSTAQYNNSYTTVACSLVFDMGF